MGMFAERRRKKEKKGKPHVIINMLMLALVGALWLPGSVDANDDTRGTAIRARIERTCPKGVDCKYFGAGYTWTVLTPQHNPTFADWREASESARVGIVAGIVAAYLDAGAVCPPNPDLDLRAASGVREVARALLELGRDVFGYRDIVIVAAVGNMLDLAKCKFGTPAQAQAGSGKLTSETWVFGRNYSEYQARTADWPKPQAGWCGRYSYMIRSSGDDATLDVMEGAGLRYVFFLYSSGGKAWKVVVPELAPDGSHQTKPWRSVNEIPIGRISQNMACGIIESVR